MHARNLPLFSCALYLFPTLEAAVVDYNVLKLHACGYPVASIKAVHSGLTASKASPDDAGGLEHLCVSVRVMLSVNLWVETGLIDGAMRIVKAICYHNATKSKETRNKIMFWDERTFWHEMIYRSLIPTFGKPIYTEVSQK